jgi:hypothetical protein
MYFFVLHRTFYIELAVPTLQSPTTPVTFRLYRDGLQLCLLLFPLFASDLAVKKKKSQAQFAIKVETGKTLSVAG